MAKAQNHFYILVFTEDGPIYVTGLDYANKYAHWNRLEKPLEINEVKAQDVVLGLNLNGYLAQVVKSKWEIEGQPYRYKVGKMVWQTVEKEEA